MKQLSRFRRFVQDLTRLVERHGADEPRMLDEGEPLLRTLVSPTTGCPSTAVSIRVYGANIGAVRRHVYDAATGQPRAFVSGYHNTTLPNLWDRSRQS